jgi:hypothetical protein
LAFPFKPRTTIEVREMLVPLYADCTGTLDVFRPFVEAALNAVE